MIAWWFKFFGLHIKSPSTNASSLQVFRVWEGGRLGGYASLMRRYGVYRTCLVTCPMYSMVDDKNHHCVWGHCI